MTGEIVEFPAAAEPTTGRLALSGNPTDEQVAAHIWAMAHEMADAVETVAFQKGEIKALRDKCDKQRRRIKRMNDALRAAEAALRQFSDIQHEDATDGACAVQRADLAALREAYFTITAHLGTEQHKDSNDE